MTSLPKQSKLGALGKPAYSKCKRFLPRNHLCSFCGVDNAPPSPNCGSMSVKNTTDGCSAGAVDVVRALADLAGRVSDLALGLGSLETRIGSVEARFGLMMNLDSRLKAFSSRLRDLEDAVTSSIHVGSDIDRLTTAEDEIFACGTALMDRIVGLEDRCVALEDFTKAINRPSSSSTIDGLESRIRSFELSQRDYEIIFGLLASQGEDRSSVISCL